MFFLSSGRLVFAARGDRLLPSFLHCLFNHFLEVSEAELGWLLRHRVVSVRGLRLVDQRLLVSMTERVSVILRFLRDDRLFVPVLLLLLPAPL